ncbi:3-ketodihydrosphingosine reductase TSC10 [Leucoagaricus sp. SymC.cos]|nr:3-ketodihydrosphingosine reductase TSC10 [Leucoagaricus sp. SymC.cos]
MFGLFSRKWNPDGLHCYVTGGSSGLGLSLAKILARSGANVSIVARDQTKLDEALKELEAERRSPNQKINAYSFALDTAEASSAALEAACALYNGDAPDATFTCAGAARPGFFVEATAEDLTKGMTNGYWIQAWTAWVISKMMVKQRRKGKITFVSSTLGYMSFIGYSSYSPAKHALRGLADTLRSEMLLYGIDIHIFFPPTMFTPGYEVENKAKPKITLKIEESDDGLTPDQAALALFKGVQNGETHITGDFITSLFRASTRGATPKNNWIIDGVYDMIATIAIPIWRTSVDKSVIAHGEEHQGYLEERAFFS